MTDQGINRRQLLIGMAAGAASTPLITACGSGTAHALAAHNSQDASALHGNRHTDVVIVGAGYAGLACARALTAKGVDVLVLEGRDRVGGRCVNQHLPSPYNQYVVEGGAEFIGPTHTRMHQLTEALGIGTFPAYNKGKTINYMDGKAKAYSGRIPPGNPIALVEAQLAISTLDSMANKVPLDKPWTASKARQWDNQTVQDWIDAYLLNAEVVKGDIAANDTKKLLRLAIIAVFSAEPKDLSLLYLLFYIHSAGSLNHLIDTKGGAQQTRIKNGSQVIANAMARQLGERVSCHTTARDVHQSGNEITVSGDGFRVTAQHAVIAMSPWPAGRLHYTPLDGPTQARLQLMQRRPMGSIWKVHCVYPTPFWRDAGLNGQVTSDAFLPKAVFDNSPPVDGAPGVIMGFIDGQDGRDAVLMSREQRKANVIQALTAYFGNKAKKPIAYLEKNWQAEDFSGGGPVGFAPPGVITDYTTALRDPIGRLHWAGTETAHVWSGYMEGAVRSGERAAKEILATTSTRQALTG